MDSVGPLLQEAPTGAGTFISRERGALSKTTAEAPPPHIIQPWSISGLVLDKNAVLEGARKSSHWDCYSGAATGDLVSRALQAAGSGESSPPKAGEIVKCYLAEWSHCLCVPSLQCQASVLQLMGARA